MSAPTSPRLMTTEELLALPDDGMDRELFHGELREKSMTKRSRWHSTIESQISILLGQLRSTQPSPRGRIVSGEAGFRLRRDPDCTVGIDVAYVSPEVAATEPDAPYFEGPPVLTAEILSPSDRPQDIDDELRLDLETGFALVWIVHPRFRTVTVYRPDLDPVMLSGEQV